MKKIFLALTALLAVLLAFTVFAEDDYVIIRDLGDCKIVGVGEYVVTPPHGPSFTLPTHMGVVDSDGNYIVQPVYEEISAHVEGRALFQKDGLFGYFDENWNEIIPARYKVARAFSLGLAAVANEDYKFGYIDVNGNVAVDLIYDGANSFYDGCAVVERIEDGYNLHRFVSYGIINHAGTILSPFKYPLADAPYRVQMSENTIRLNGCVYKNSELEYPFINYYGITYMPLTFYTCMHLGFTTTWSQQDGLCLTPPNSVPAVRGDEKCTFGNITGENDMKMGKQFNVELYKGTLTVGGKTYTADEVYYPLLTYKNIVYVPLLWRQGIEAMGLDYTYDLDTYSIILNTRMD